MTPGQIFERIGRRLTVTPRVAIGLAIALLIAGLGLAIHNEDIGKAEKVRAASVQVQILAGTLAAPLAFDDINATQEYMNALRADPDIEAAAAYDSGGVLAAGYSRGHAALPRINLIAPPVFEQGDLVVTAPVMQGSTRLGSVYLRAVTESFSRRAMRYLGIALIVVMASLLVAVLGASYASVSEAHRKLQQEIEGRQEAEEALRQSQKMEAMGQLTGGVAHDFNNLLMVASGGLDLMDRTTDPARREKLKAGIRQAIERGASLTQQLLAFSRRSPLKLEVVDLGERIGGMHQMLERSLRENISVDVRIASDLWAVEIDPSQLEVAVLNIALNARDAMPLGGAIAIRAENLPGDPAGGGDMVRLSISDTGVGIPPDMLARVFEPFFTTKQVGQGTGLGLSQVYGFARAANGDVKVSSEVGQGATISILMPRSLKAVVRPEAAALDPEAGPSRRRRRVLLVEDDELVAGLVGEMLHELGYDVHRAAMAAAGLEALESDPAFDIIFSDMMMPGDMNGMDLAREAAVRRPDLPIVLTTGYSTAAAQAAAEGVRLLLKPYQIGALGAELQAAFAERAAEMRH